MSLKLEELVGKPITEAQFDEAAGKKDACYHKVKARYDVWPSAYASGALVKCRKVGAANWGNKSKKEGVNEDSMSWEKDFKGYSDKELKVISKFIMLNDKGIDGVIKMSKKKAFKPMIKKMAQKGLHENVNEGKFRVHFDLNPDASPAQRLGLMSVEVTAKDKKEAEKMVASKFVGGMKLIRKNMTKKLKENVNEAPKIDSKLMNRLKSLNDEIYKLLANYRTVPKIDKVVGAWMKGLHRSLDNLNIKIKESVDQDVFFESITEGDVTTTHIHWESNGKGHGYTVEYVNDGKLNEAEYQGRKVKLGKVMQGDAKKFKVYVKNPKGNVVKVNFGQGGDAKGGTMRIRKSNPKARANFRARHNCDNPGPRHKARYWSCKKW